MKPVPLAEAADVERFGGKAAQLARAAAAGLPVPRGWALSVEHVSDVVDGSEAAGAAALASLIDAAGGQALAVRSSSVGEDGERASFAGQHLSVLGVRGREALRDAVARVAASARAPGALGYRRHLGIEAAPRMAVIVQHLVAADVAGVLFSRNPIDGRDERVVEASWGLGEVVVAGRVTPDRYRVARGGAVLDRIAGEKDVAIWLEDALVRERPVGPADATRLCLDDGALAALDALATRCEAVFPGAQDLEWAFAGGTLYLLQRRPITGLEVRGRPALGAEA